MVSIGNEAQIRIDANFPGGNILVEEVREDKVWMRQDLRTNVDDWFYWNFRVRGAAGRKLQFIFTGGDVFGARGPCFSSDGIRWKWLGREILDGNSFTFAFPSTINQAFFSFGVPYTENNLVSFLAEHPGFEKTVLAQSEKGRAVEKLSLWSKKGTQHILLTARHHACEAMANYVLEGVLTYFSGDSAEALFLRNEVDVHIVPFVDKDGVEDGDQGKMRPPHDHWEDYGENPIYNTTRAIIEESRTWRGKLSLALDLHCPAMRGDSNDEIFVVEPEPVWMPKMNQFYNILERESLSSIPFDRKNGIHYGVDWNVAGPNSSDYFRNNRQVMAFTFEFPYAQASGKTVTVENARSFGEALGKTILLFIQNKNVD